MTASTPHRLRRPARVSAAAVAVLLLGALGSLALGVSPAAAHAALISSNPADGATLDRAPDSVTLTFSESVGDPAFVAVTSADGTALVDGDPGVDGADVTQSLETGDATGTLTVAYRVVSADGHPIEGELSFDVRRAAPEPTQTPSASPQDPADDADPSSTTDEPVQEADTEPAAQQTDGTDGYWDSYGTVTLIGLGVAAAVVALLLAARRKGQGTG